MTKLKRLTLRDQARDVIRELILDERLAPGARVNESHLADQLEISRSPIREALGQLEQEGFLDNRPGAGYTVRSLTASEAEELYVVLADLESLAVRLVGPPAREKLAELRRLNDDILQSAGEPTAAIDVNFRWHRTLVSDCGNATLLGLLDTLRAKIYRYEYAYFRPTEAVEKSTAFHLRILGALDPFDAEAAREAIEEHWLSDLDAVLPRIGSES